MLHLWAGPVGVAVPDGVVVDVQHGSNMEAVVPVQTQLAPQHQGHGPALVRHLEVRLDTRGQRWMKRLGI